MVKPVAHGSSQSLLPHAEIWVTCASGGGGESQEEGEGLTSSRRAAVAEGPTRGCERDPETPGSSRRWR